MTPVNNLNNSVVGTARQGAAKAKSSALNKADSPNNTSGDQITISNASNLKQMEKSMASSPEIDMDKVNKIKQAISSGEYQIDAQLVAKNFFSIEQSLGKI